MNIFDLIGNFIVTAIAVVTKYVTLATDLLKKKVLVLANQTQNKNSKQTSEDSKTKSTSLRTLKEQFSKRAKTDASESTTNPGLNPFTITNPVPGTDLLAKEGWTRVNVHPVPETGQQVLILQNEKTRQAKMLGKEAFLEYLKELNEKHSR